MSVVWNGFRTIVEDHRAAASVDDFSDQFDRFDEAWDGAKWRLSRNPEIGRQGVYEDIAFQLYNFAGDPIAGTPDIWVIYSYTDSEVTIHAVHATNAQITN